MKYLDERITTRITGLLYIGGTFRYSIVHNYETIFEGIIFLDNGSTYADFDITDIVRNYKDNGALVSIPFTTQHILDGGDNIKPIKTFNVILHLDNSNTRMSDDIDVVMTYRYPHRMSKMELPLFDQSSTADKLALFLQGGSNTVTNKKPHLLPRYPYRSTDQYGYAGLFMTSNTYNTYYPAITMVGAVSGSGLFEYTTRWVAQTWSLEDLFETVLTTSSEFVDVQNTTVTGNAEFINSGVIKMWTNTDYVETLHRVELNYGDGSATQLWGKWWSGSGAPYINSEKVTVPIKITSTSQLNKLKTYGLRLWFNRSYQDEGYINFPLVNLTGPERNWIGTTLNFSFTWGYMSFNEQWAVSFNSVIGRLVDENGSEDESTLYIDTLPVAKIDLCEAKYYLMWQDRGGSYQSQPFDGKSVFSEDFKRETMENYANEKRDFNIIVTPKWKINTKWIPEEYYPYYESIFVSPKLILYDTAEDFSYNVLVKGNYVEKTFKNEKKLISIELELEENKTQNILY